MSKLMVALALIVAVGLAVPAFAGDIVDMPTGNMVAPKHAEINYIFWDLDTPPGAPDFINIYEGFVGVTDWLELDAIVADVDKDQTYCKFNAYASLIKEAGPRKPSLIVGATNLTSSAWPGNSNFSPFILSACNLLVPAGPPKLTDPLVRAHLAYGWEAHQERFFGGIQVLVSPQLGGAVFSYQNAPAYVLVYRPCKRWELRGGWKDAQPFGSLGAFLDW